MYWISQLLKLVKDIETSEINIDILETQKRELIKKSGIPKGLNPINYSGLPGGKGAKYNLPFLVEEIQEINYKLENEYMIFTDLQNTYDKYKNKLKSSNNLKCKIAYLRLVESRTYKEIAADLNLSESYIRSSANKMFKEIGHGKERFTH